jgi:hypothetical protein
MLFTQVNVYRLFGRTRDGWEVIFHHRQHTHARAHTHTERGGDSKYVLHKKVKVYDQNLIIHKIIIQFKDVEESLQEIIRVHEL